MKKNLLNIFLLLLIASTAIIYTTHFNKPKSVTHDESKRQVLRILFIGNSYTSLNELPRVLTELAAHDPDADFKVETHMFTQGGATLGHLLTRPETNKILTSKQWHYVVLQPQSLWATTKKRTLSTNMALAQWNRKINAIGAIPVFFMTWPRKPGTNWYQKGKFSFLESAEMMFAHIRDDSKNFAKKYDLLLAPVGSYWMYLNDANAKLNLYDPDGSHPSKKGTFLAALLFHKMLVSKTLGDITYYPKYLNANERKAIFATIDGSLPPSYK